MTHSDHIVPEKSGWYWWVQNTRNAEPEVLELFPAQGYGQRILAYDSQTFDWLLSNGTFLHQEPLVPPGE